MIPDEAFWHALADAAAAVTLPRFRTGAPVENKRAGGFDPVTTADRDAERAIRALIRESYPDDAIFGEEQAAQSGTSGRRWVIDPIDGTRAFVSGVPVWMTLVGLEIDGRAVAGLAAQPWTGERFLALDADATLLRGGERTQLRCRPSAPDDAIAMTVDPFLFEGAEREAFDAVRRGVRLVRYSADAYAFCGVALGTVQIAFERGVAPYDIGALIPLVEAAGGVFTTWDGGRPERGGNVVASASTELHEWALSRLQGVSAVR